MQYKYLRMYHEENEYDTKKIIAMYLSSFIADFICPKPVT